MRFQLFLAGLNFTNTLSLVSGRAPLPQACAHCSYELAHQALTLDKWPWSLGWPSSSATDTPTPTPIPLQHTATLPSPPPQGFGNVAREHWLGNEAVHHLTSRTACVLRVELQDWEGRQTSIQYEHFQLGNERQRYRWAWGPGLWVVWGPKASGCSVFTQGHSLGVSYFHHLGPIWVHVTGPGGGCLALSTSRPLGGVKRLSLTPPCLEQEGIFQG